MSFLSLTLSLQEASVRLAGMAKYDMMPTSNVTVVTMSHRAKLMIANPARFRQPQIAPV